jgi:hypothetical protein
MITLDQYFGDWYECPDATEKRKDNAERLLDACSDLEALARADGVVFPINQKTGSQVSGETYGGFRPQACSIGAAHSSHKEGLAVDIYDPDGEIDAWCMAHQDLMAQCKIYIEDPNYTKGWSHWTIKAPGSGHRVFIP